MGTWVQLRDADMNTGYTGGWCLKFVQDSFGTDHPYPSAIDAWNANYGNGNHAGEDAPMGITVPVYFSLGNVPAGHVADRLDDGYVASSTQAGYHSTPYYHPNIQNLEALYGQYNGGCNYLGWSEYVGSVKVVGWQDYNDQRYSEPIAFESTTENDDTLPVGQTAVKQQGVNGEHWWIDHIRTIDGAEQDRARIDEGITAAVPQITSIGTYVAPEPPVVVEPPTEPTKPTDPVTEPTTPTEPVIPEPPVSSENNIWNIIKRVVQFLLTKLRELTQEK